MIRSVEFFLLPPVVLVIFFIVFLLIYAGAGALAAKGKKLGGKLTSYACGENVPGFKPKFSYEFFFLFALFYTIMHVAVLVVATIPGGPVAYLGIVYLVMVFLSVLALLTRSNE
jgi:hypothetical protein